MTRCSIQARKEMQITRQDPNEYKRFKSTYLDHGLASSHVAGRVHAVNAATFGIDVRKLRESAVREVRVELVGVDELVLSIVLDPLIHPSVDDVSLVVVLPRDVGVLEGLEDAHGAVGASGVLEVAGSLVGVVDISAGRARGGELAVGVGRARVLGVVRVPESKVLCKIRKHGALVLAVGLDDERRVAGCLHVLRALALNETHHVGSSVLGRVPFAVNLVGSASEVMVGVLKWDLGLVGTSADHDGLVPDGPVGVGVLVAVADVPQVVDVRVEILQPRESIIVYPLKDIVDIV